MFKTKEEKVKTFFEGMSKEEKFEFLNGIMSEEEKEELVKEEEQEETKEEQEEETKTKEKTKETKEEETSEKETKEEETSEKETKEEFDVDAFKNEIKEELKNSIKEQIDGLNLEEKFKPYVTKDELKEIEKEIPKAKDFGADSKNTSVEENDFEKSRERILKNLN